MASVASFFISRIDSTMDARIDALPDAQRAYGEALKGRIAIANANRAYAHYQHLIASDRWQALAAKAAMPQRLLWASTGTKNPAYRDVLYIEELAGPDTVNTVPPATLDAFRDHGRVREALTEGQDEAEAVLRHAESLGLDLNGATQELAQDGVTQFVAAFDNLLAAVGAEASSAAGTGEVARCKGSCGKTALR